MAHSRFRKTERKARALCITPLGHRILRAVERGTYKFSTQSRPKRAKGRKHD